MRTHASALMFILAAVLPLPAGAQVAFSEAQHFPGSTWITNSLVVGDVDRDGDLDVFFGNESGNGGNQAFLNTGTGFAAAPWWPTALDRSTNALACGDLDGDGMLDLVSADFNSRVPVHLNAAGTLTAAADLLVGTSRDTWDLVLADLDRDGHLDLVTANLAQANQIFYGTASGLSLDPGWSSPDASRTLQVACGDINGDGWLDLVFGNQNEANTVFLNSATGFGQEPADWASSAARSTISLALGDLDGDGDLDLVCGNGGFPATNHLYLNEGGMFLTDPVVIGSDQEQTLGVALGDVDADGDLDVLFGNYEAPNTLYLNRGSGNFGTTWDWSDGGDTTTKDLALADLDGDGLLDIVCANDGEDNTYHFNRSGPVGSVPVWESDLAEETSSVALGDVDLDGDLDLVCGQDNALQANGLFLNTDGVFAQVSTWKPDPGTMTRSVVLGDIDGDGRLDVVCGNYGQPNTLHLNTGGNFGPDVWGHLEARFTNDLALGDVDGDGDLDLACANNFGTAGQLRNTLYLNEGGRFSLTPDWESGPGNMTDAVAFGDVDSDGDLDLVCGNLAFQAGDSNCVYLNHGGMLATEPSWQSAAANRTRCLALGDVDGDGDPDLVCGNGASNTQSTAIYLNSPDGFEETPSWNTEDAGICVEVLLVDLDADGDLDLVRTMNDGPSRIHINAGGALSESSSLVLGQTGARGLAAGDVDGDNDPDLVMANLNWPNRLYPGRYGAAQQAAAAGAVHGLAHHPAVVRDVAVAWRSTNSYTVELSAVDVESDPVYLIGEYQLEGDPTWYRATLDGAEQAAGPLASSPTGLRHTLNWDVFLAPIDARRIVLRLRAYSLSQGVSVYTAIPPYLSDPLSLVVNRPQIAIQQDGLAFPTMTVGDDAVLDLPVRNSGTETLTITEVLFPDTEMRLGQGLPVDLEPGQAVTFQVHLEPRAGTGVAGDMSLLSNDPLSPSATVPVTTDILPLDFLSRLLTQEEILPLGEAVTVIVTPSHQVNVEGGFLYHRPAVTGAAFLDSLPLVADADDFIAVVPGSAVTEVGLDYYVRVENNGVFATDPPTAPAGVIHREVQAPVGVTLYPQVSSSSGYLTGREVRVEADLAPGAGFVSGLLHFRAGGETAFTSVPFTGEDVRPVAVIPDSAVGLSGLEYWCEIQTLTTHLVDPPGIVTGRPHVLPVTVPSLTVPGEVDPQRYRMVSIPLDFGAEFSGTLESMLYVQDAYGSYDPKRWRSFRYDPVQARYLELPGNNPAFRLEPGRAFWLVCRQSEAPVTAPLEGRSPSTAMDWEITLAPGWNQVGNPFAFPVAWESVSIGDQTLGEAVDAAQVEPPVAWAWDTGTYVNDPARLDPFEGYWIRNLTEADVVMRVAPVRDGPVARTSRPTGGSRDGGWDIVMRAFHGQRASGPAVLGVRPDARGDRDAYDRTRTPPAPGPDLSVYVPQGDWAKGPGPMIRDIRPGNEDGWFWDIAVGKTYAEAGVEDLVRLTVAGLDSLPETMSVVLYDRVARRETDLRAAEGLYEVRLGLAPLSISSGSARFRLLVGDAAYVDAHREDSGPPPATVLLPNRPNPFNPATLLRFDLDREAHVFVTIHDLRGYVVDELVDGPLPAGRQEYLWRGVDSDDRPVAAGVYIYRLRTDFGYEATGKMTLVR